MVLDAEEGTQGRDMNRKVRIASVVALVGLLAAAAPSAAPATTPMLSGYGGPGAGEQAIVGSTLLAGPRGGAGSGGSSSSGGSGSPSVGGSGETYSSGSTPAGGSGVSSTGGSSTRSSTSKRAIGKAGRGRQAERSSDGQAGAVGAYVYPKLPGSTSSDSHVIGISSGDVLPLIGIVLALALIGAFTVRFARLQP